MSGYLLLASKIYENPARYSGAWNFGPLPDSAATVKEVVEKIIKYYGSGEWKNVSSRSGSGVNDDTKGGHQPHEAKLLNLDIDKAVSVLGWKPKLNIDEAVKLTVDYYKRRGAKDVYELCGKQIRMYAEKMQNKNR